MTSDKLMASKIPRSAMDRVIREVGAERVSDDAKEALQDILSTYCIQLSRTALQLSKHAQRSTILKDDVRLAKE